MANTETNPFAYNPAAAADLFGLQPAAPTQAPPAEDISQYMPQPQQGPASSYGEAFLKAEGQYGLPEGLLSAIGYNESRYNPNAVSPAGATGLMQLMPPTAKEYGVDARDPYASIDAAGKKMAGLVKYYNGDMAKAVAAYNYGEGNLNKAIRKAGDNWLSATPRETQLYVSNVLGGAPPPEQEGPKGEMYEIPLASGKTLYVPKGMPREEALASAREQGFDAVGLRDIPLASGKTLQVPEHLTDEEAIKQASEANPDMDFTLPKKETEGRTFGGGLEDIGATALKGGTAALQGFIGLADIITPGDLGAVIQNNVIDLSKYQDYLDKQFTPQQQQAIKNLNEAHGLGNILQAAIDNPSAVLSMLGQAAPQMVGGAGIAKAGLMGLGKVLTKVPAVAPYIAAGIGEGGVGAGAQKENLRVTNPEGEATGANTEAALMTGVGSTIVGGLGAKATTALGGIDPNILLSGNARKMALQEFGDVANTPGFFRSTIVSMIGEGVFQEAPQSAIEQMSQNFATDRPLFEGVEDESVKGALMGAIMGGGANTASQLVGTTEQAPPPPPAPVNPPAGEIPVPPQGEVPAPPVNPLLITPEERARVAEAAAGGPPVVAEAEEVVAGAPVAGAPVAGVPAEEVVAVKEPTLRGKKEKPAKPVKTEPTWVTDMLGLHKKSGVYKKIATQGLDINNPADHEAIRKITDPVIAELKRAGTITEEQSKILPNYMEAIQQGQTTPTLGETTDAQQIPSTSPINGDGSTQSQESQAAEDITQAGKGVESGGQGIEAIETGAQEEVAPIVSPALVSVAQTVLDRYDANIIKSKTGEPSQANINALYKTAAELGLDIPPDTPHADIANQIEAAIVQPDVTLPKGLTVPVQGSISEVINKAAKKDEVVDEGLQARWIQHAKEGTLHKAEDDVTDFHYDLKTSNPSAHAKAEQANTQAIKAAEDAKTLAAEERIAKEDKLERETKAANLETIKKTVEAKQAEVVTTTPITEAAITDIIQEANLNPEDDSNIAEQIDFSNRYQESVAPTSELTGHTAASLSKTLSPEMKRLVASGKAVMHDTAETLPEGKHPENVQGLTTAEGVTHYVANKLTPETLESVALHEVGTHVGMENLVGAKVYKDIAHQALNNVGEVFDKARASIPKDTPTHLRHHEALAYLVENAPNLPVVKKIVSAVRNFARMHLGMKLQLTEADARHLAVKALRRESKTTKRTARKEGTSYSIKPTKDAQDIGKALVGLGLVKTSDKSISGVIREAVSGFMTGDNIVKLRAGWVDDSAALSRLLKPLDMFDPKGKMRGDFVLQSIGNLSNMLRNSRGYIDTTGDGTLMSVDDPRLDLHNNIKLIDGLGYKDNRKTFFTALRVVAGKEILRIDVERRADAKLYKDFEKVLQGDIDHLTGALVDARRALAAAVTAKDAVQIKDFKSVISIITKEKAALTTRATQLKEESNRLFAKHGKKSAVDVQADIDAKIAKAEKKEALAATTTDKTKRDALLDQVERLRDDADRLTETLEVGVGTEQRVTPEDIALTEALLIEDPRLGDIMNNIFERLRKDVDLFEKAGIINSTTANDWRSNPAYIPLYKSIEDLSDDPSKYVEVLSLGAKHSWEVKSREGSKQTVNVAENLVKHSALMAGAAAQNIARQTAAMQLNAVADTLFYETKDRSDPQATKFKVNGEDVYYHIGDTLAFEAFQTMIPLQPGWMRKVAKAHANVFRKVTLTTPVYWYRQLIRDPLMANLVTQSGLITPLHALYHMGKIVARRSEGYNELQRRGITGAVDTLTDTTQLVKSIATKRGVSGWLRDFIVHVHEASDAGTRVAVYEKALKLAAKRGIVDPQQRKNFAAMQAKELINFSKKGKSRNHAAMRDSVPFFASTLNGMDTLARAAIPGGYGNLNVKDAATVRKHFYANAAMVTTASILYALQMDDDEEYRKSTDWITSWLIPTGNKDNPFIKIPIHFEAGFLFKVIPEILVRVSRGSLTPKGGRKALWEAFKALSVPPILPQTVKPVGEVLMNHDLYTGNPINSFTESRLPLNQRTAHATPLAEKIAGGLPSFLNMSPNDIEHLGKGWFTEAWALSALLADAYISSVTGVSAPTKELGEKFLWKGVVTAPAKDKALSDYYALAKSAEQIVNGIRAYKQVGDKEGAKALRNEPENEKLRKMAPLLGATGEQIGTMQGRIARIKNKPDTEMSPDEKATRIRVLQEKINKLAGRAIKRADEKGVSR